MTALLWPGLSPPCTQEPDALSDLGWFDLDDLPAALTEATKQAVVALKRGTI